MFEEIPINCKYAYALVSSKSQQDNSSLESQKEGFCKKLGKSIGIISFAASIR